MIAVGTDILQHGVKAVGVQVYSVTVAVFGLEATAFIRQHIKGSDTGSQPSLRLGPHAFCRRVHFRMANGMHTTPIRNGTEISIQGDHTLMPKI